MMLANILALAALTVAADGKLSAVYTVPHELDILIKAGHIQGAACSEQGVYLAHSQGIEKIGWDGKRIRRVTAPSHLGDIDCAKGRVYGAFVLRGVHAGKKPGMVRVWNEDLEVVADKRFDVNLDGCVVLSNTVYVGIDRWGRDPHAGCAVMTLDLDLNERERRDLDLGYFIHYGVQTMATDGRDLFFGNYGAPARQGNAKGFNLSQVSADLRLLSNGSLRGCSQGFGRVPKSVTKRETPVFFCINPLGGGIAAWRKDPVGNPPRIRIDFLEFVNGTFRDITIHD